MFPPLLLKQAMLLGGLAPKELVLRTWRKMDEHEIMTRASAVSFYAMLALVPFLALILTVTVQLLPDLSGITGQSAKIGNLTADELDATLKDVFPDEAYQVVHDQIIRLQGEARPSWLILLFGLGVTIWLASSLFVSVIDAMNRINGVSDSRSFLRIRVIAIVMTCVQALILIGSLLAIVLWPQILGRLGMSAPAQALATVVQWSVIYGTVLTSFAVTFYVAPDSEQRWEWITPGSLLGTLVFLAASVGFRVYVQNFSNYNRTYGSLGGVMVLLFWFWISSLVLLTAAQMNRLIEEASPLGKSYGQKIDTTAPPDLSAIAPEPSTR